MLLQQVSAQTKYVYATCNAGGSCGGGTMLAADDTGGNFRVVYNFIDSLGRHPQGRIVQGANGNIYGCSQKGSCADSSYLFSFNPLTGAFKVLRQFVFSPQEGYRFWWRPYTSA